MNSVTFSNTDTNTKQQRFIGQIQAYTTYVTLMYNTYTNMYIHHTLLSSMTYKEQYIDDN